MISNRKKLILKYVIENYSKNSKPVSSKSLTDIKFLNFSSSTIRFDMAKLEKQGFLEKNYNSSGRIPSLKGYIYYLNNLTVQDQKIRNK